MSARLRRIDPPAGAGRPGFTLLELLVAIGLLATILALVFGAFSQISGGASSVQNQVDDQQSLRFLVALIADDLAAAQHLPELAKRNLPTGIVGKREYVANGQYTRIDFHAAVPARFNRQIAPEQDPELHEIGYRMRQSKDRQKLELARREDFYLDDDLAEGGIEAPLADNVKEFHVEFLGTSAQPPATESEENWLELWDSKDQGRTDKRPVAIRVTLTLTGRDGRDLSETLVVNFPASLQ
jgi:prepilin-type N-terminal cleavage/methylation domain-containing protein